MNILIIRHGEPNYAIDSLTEKGWREAHYLADRLCKMKIDEVYCSPLGRAKDTAKEYLERTGRTAPVLDWLCEFRGKLDIDGETKRIAWDILPKTWRNRPLLHEKDHWTEDELVQNGNMIEQYQRVVDGLDQFLAEHGYERDGDCYKVVRPNTDTIVFFCHFAIQSVLISRILGLSPVDTLHDFSAYPTSITTLSTEEREKGVAIFRCNGYGDISHLYAVGEEPSPKGRYQEVFEEEKAE